MNSDKIGNTTIIITLMDTFDEKDFLFVDKINEWCKCKEW